MTSRQRGWLLPPASVSLIAGVFLGRETPVVVYAMIACAVCLCAVFLLKGRLRFVSCIILSFAVGVLSGSAAFHPSLPPEGDYLISGILSDDVSYGRFGQVKGTLTTLTLDGQPVSGNAYWTFYSDDPPADLLPGKLVTFRGSLYHPDGAVNPGGYNFRESLLQRGITVGVYGQEELHIRDPESFHLFGRIAFFRHSLSESLSGILGEETGALASTLLLGMRSRLPAEDRDAFSRLGIAHILSVSGFHVGILIGLLAALFRLLHLRQGIRLVLYTFLLFFYAALCGMNLPVIRASLFLLLALEGKILNRPRSGLHILCAALYLMVLFSPVQVTSASFQLSFFAMFGLVWFTPAVSRINPFRRKIPRVVFSSVLLSLGVQLALLFPELLFFQRLPLLGFLINWPATIVFSVLILCFWFILLCLPFPGIGSLLSGPLSWAAGLLLDGVRSLGAVPGLTLWLPSPSWLTALGILLLILGFSYIFRLSGKLRTLLLAAGTAVLVCSLIPPRHTGTEYIQFSAGNADAAVIHDEDTLIVIDAGEEDSMLSSFLRSRRLIPDAVILTHLHADHAGGLRSILEDDIPIPLLYLPVGAELQQVHPDFLDLLSQLRQAGTDIRYLSRGSVVPLPSGTLTVLWPEEGRVRTGQDANNYSLAALLNLKGTRMLLTGDLTGIYEHYAAVPADLLKAAHHGSLSSTSEIFLSKVSPRLILLSCRYPARLSQFRERCAGYHVYGTPESGAITVRFEEGGYTVQPFLSSSVIGGK